MSHQAITALSQTLRSHVGLGKCRLETLCMLVVGMVGARTVNLGHIATEAGRGVLIASTYRRLQRFFQHVDFGPTGGSDRRAADRIDLRLDARTRPDELEDRDAGRELSCARGRHPALPGPPFWTLLDGPGNSATEIRIALMTRISPISRPRRSGSCSRIASSSGPSG